MGCICAADPVEVVEGDAARHLSDERAALWATLRHAAPMSRPKSASVIEATIAAVTPTPTWSAWEVHGALGLRPGQVYRVAGWIAWVAAWVAAWVKAWCRCPPSTLPYK